MTIESIKARLAGEGDGVSYQYVCASDPGCRDGRHSIHCREVNAYRETTTLRARIATLEAQVEQARATNARLNRVCTSLEGAIAQIERHPNSKLDKVASAAWRQCEKHYNFPPEPDPPYKYDHREGDKRRAVLDLIDAAGSLPDWRDLTPGRYLDAKCAIDEALATLQALREGGEG